MHCGRATGSDRAAWILRRVPVSIWSCRCKSITSDGKMLVHLIASKSRVAPTKQTTIPRLELCAAVLIATIQEMTSSEQWRYVATEDNPADFVSRGMDSLKLKTCELWWNGPKFLMSNQYPQRQIPVAVIKDPDLFIIVRTKKAKRIGPLDLGELKRLNSLLKLVQKEEFKVEMNGIQNSAMVPSNSRVKTLNPFIDSEGILRVGGRLRNSDINYNQKFPILLPSKHKLTYLIVEYFHKKFLHSGPNPCYIRSGKIFGY
ncbi:uncharacterized protein TNCV_1499891 [Trichonephila clavipes]|nr:uncharacterized protein TNCV_1499891 [Trichonephila clavipes]